MLRRLLRRRAGPPVPPGLDVCPRCGTSFVCAVDWEPGGVDVRLVLRCGQCEDRREVTLPRPLARAVAEEMERGWREIADAVARLEREQFEVELETLSIALERDLIDAADFRPHREAGL